MDSADAERVYREQLSKGKSHYYAKAYASKIHEGETFARVFAQLREKRALEKLSARQQQEQDEATRQADLQRKRSINDFNLFNVLGEGSYSTVYLAREIKTEKYFALKELDKAHIKKERKEKYVMTERDVFNALRHPFIVRLYYTFQTPTKLYFALDYCSNGELLKWIRKLECFDEECTRFYAAEMVLALEHMHSRGIIHRDLKPENVLLDDKMHIKITDFGTAKMLSDTSTDERADSFVGTAQYVSPELLRKEGGSFSADLWALGCIIYQLLSGYVPFLGNNDYQTFQKIQARDFVIPEGFPGDAKDLVEKLLVLDPEQRLGCAQCGGFDALKAHPFFQGIDWDQLHEQTPPKLEAFLPARNAEEKPIHSSTEADDLLLDMAVAQQSVDTTLKVLGKRSERQAMLRRQQQESVWQQFLDDDELIVKTGLVDKRKGLFAKRRQLILTDAPKLIYVDPDMMELKGEIPWSEELFPQYKNMKTFFVHTPNRTYYLEDVERSAITWVDSIQQLLRLYKSNETSA